MSSKFKIKVCGMRDAYNVSEVAALHPDYMGFIFYQPSPRDCRDMDPDVVKSLPSDILSVAVTVDMAESEIMSLVNKYGFKAVQLHGNESPEFCSRLREKGLRVFKAISVKNEESVRIISDYEGVVDMFVFDTFSSSKGGSGKKFNWSILEDAEIHTDFLLSGGIGAEDLEAVKRFEHIHLAGIDLNSRFETSPGLKDVGLLKRFIEDLSCSQPVDIF